jgi:hypothetical protein
MSNLRNMDGRREQKRRMKRKCEWRVDRIGSRNEQCKEYESGRKERAEETNAKEMRMKRGRIRAISGIWVQTKGEKCGKERYENWYGSVDIIRRGEWTLKGR